MMRLRARYRTISCLISVLLAVLAAVLLKHALSASDTSGSPWARPAPRQVLLKYTLSASGTGTDVYTAHDVASLTATVSLESVDGSIVPFAYGRPLPSFDQQSHHPTLSLAGTWRKERVPLDHDLSLTDRLTALAQIESEGGGRHLPGYNDSSWETKTLPAVENTVPITESLNGAEVYQDGVWYRRTFTVDSDWESKQVRLVFLAVNYVADVWVNGTWVGYHEGGYTPFALDVTASLSYGVSVSNTIAVRVDNPPWGSRTDIVPALRGTDWHNYTGIIQDVYLEQLPEQYVARADVVPLDIDGNLAVKVVLFNADSTTQTLTATVEVYTANVTETNVITSPYASDLISSSVSLSGTTSRSANVPGNGTRVLTYSVGIPSPNLWTPANPNLYILKVTLHKGGEKVFLPVVMRSAAMLAPTLTSTSVSTAMSVPPTPITVVDVFHTQFGVRTVGIGEGAKFLLNRRPVFVTGMARHEDWLGTGRTATMDNRTATMDKIWFDLDLIKQADVNFLRTAHYPNHPYTYLLADRMGLMVMEEIPTWWFGAYEWADQEQRRIADQMWREMIFRDYNRPSIVLWSGTNEAEKTSLERRRAFLTRINRDLKLNYYDGRLVTQSAAANRPGAEDHTMNAVDVAGWTTYFGVFYGDTEHPKYYTETLEFLDAAHAAFPNKPILGTEFGSWSEFDDSRAEWQVKVFSETFKAFEDRKAVNISGNVVSDGFAMAGTWWTAFNWFTQSEPTTPTLQTMGASHMDRINHKPVYTTMQARYAPYSTTGGLANTTMNTLPVEIPDVYTVPQPSSVPATLLQDFEYEDSYYEVFQANASLSTEITHTGNSSLKMTGIGGEWHTVGAYLYNRPLDLTSFSRICIWVYDDTNGNNTMGLRLLDKFGGSWEVWSDWLNACDTTHTQLNSWVRMCFNLAVFDQDQVDLSALAKVQMCMYSNGDYYFDDITVY